VVTTSRSTSAAQDIANQLNVGPSGLKWNSLTPRRSLPRWMCTIHNCLRMSWTALSASSPWTGAEGLPGQPKAHRARFAFGRETFTASRDGRGHAPAVKIARRP
jgi:hypothetical protein